MPISNREAFLQDRAGLSVVVVCAECGERVWTADSMYLEGADEWFCGDCNDGLLKDAFGL